MIGRGRSDDAAAVVDDERARSSGSDIDAENRHDEPVLEEAEKAEGTVFCRFLRMRRIFIGRTQNTNVRA
jgi:hypothetical protein